jgi:hypothetical protein
VYIRVKHSLAKGVAQAEAQVLCQDSSSFTLLQNCSYMSCRSKMQVGEDWEANEHEEACDEHRPGPVSWETLGKILRQPSFLCESTWK